MATDPLSLVFLACFLFGLLFFVGTILLGSLGHAGHTGHATHVGGHAATHVGGHAPSGVSHASTHTTHAVSQAHGHTIADQHGDAHIHHAGNFSLETFLNPTAIALFLLGFGFFGYVFHNTAQFVLPLTLLFAAVGGLVIAALLLLLVSRLFGDSEGATVQDVSDRTGLLGKVSITIQENSIGEILYVSPGGMRKSIAARSINGQRIESGQEVVVVNYQRGKGIAEVDTWDHFMHDIEESEEGEHLAQAAATAQKPDADSLAKLRSLLEESDTKDTELVIRNDSQKE